MCQRIERSSGVFEKEDFTRLTTLFVNNLWLLPKHEAMDELWMLANYENKMRLFELLINNFHYVDNDECLNNLRLVVDNIEQQWKLRPVNTFIFATSKNSHPDGSQYLVQMMKNQFNPSDGWLPINFFNTVSEVEDKKAKYIIGSSN